MRADDVEFLPALRKQFAQRVCDGRAARDIGREVSCGLCEAYFFRWGWERVQVFRDAALSVASAVRPGYQALLESGRLAAFDVVVPEALGRLSSDQEDIAGLCQQLRFADIRTVPSLRASSRSCTSGSRAR